MLKGAILTPPRKTRFERRDALEKRYSAQKAHFGALDERYGALYERYNASYVGILATFPLLYAEMDHFDIIQTLCRTGLATGSPAVRQQIERLRDALAVEGATEAAALSRLLSGRRSAELRPNRLIRASESLVGETLGERTILPVDRETSTALAEVILADQLPLDGPLLPVALTKSISTLLDEWSNVARLRAGGVEPAMSALLYGPPGTGKTQTALWIGRQLGLPVVVARLDGLISSFLGTTSRNIGSLFSFAERYSCLLLLDEFDAIAKMRDDPQEVGEIKRVVNTLLQNLDSRKKIGPTIAVTNHEGLLDTAVWRRFDVQIGLTAPTQSVRLEIIRRYAPPLELSETQLNFLAWCLADVAGADIETFLRSLKRAYLIREADGQFDFLAAVREYVTLNTNRFFRQRAAALQESDEQLARIIHFDQDARAIDIHELFPQHRTTINRWIRTSNGASELTHA